ncbi:MAG: hypothetical protein OCD03_13160 [Hyphomicrobiales bacterium]
MSQRDSGFTKIRNDFYATPEWAVECLMIEESFSNRVVEPSSGQGHIADYLMFNGFFVTCIDITDHSTVDICCDFLEFNIDADNILTNPPYGNGGRLAVKFIEHSLKSTQVKQGKVAMLLRADFDSGKTRAHLFANCPAFKKKLILTDRIAWANIEQTATPSVNHAWFIWDWTNTEPPTIAYGGKQ